MFSKRYSCVYTFLALSLLVSVSCKNTELTFELPDSARECFYEEIEKNTSATLEFQVL